MSKVGFSKTGKHGHAKWTFFCKYPCTGQTSQEMYPGHTHLTKPEISKSEWLLVNCHQDGKTKAYTGNIDLMDD